MESKKVVQHVYLVGAKSIYRVAEKDKEYLRDEEEKNQNTACPAEILSIIRSTAENKVIHLHGMYDERDGIDNIIADYIQYQTILRNSGAQFIQNLIGTNPIIIVGCGGTMEDPNLSGFMSFAYEKLGTSDIPYFYLMKSGDTIPNLPMNAIPVFYGDDYEDLPLFLSEIAMTRLQKRAGLQSVIAVNPYLERRTAISAFGRMHFSNSFNPFVGRTVELNDLSSFLQDKEKFLWRTILGEGGIGKSRLILEWMKTMPSSWFGFFAYKKPEKAHLFVPFADTVVAFDYVLGQEQQCADTIAAFIEAFSDSPYKLRIVLLERHQRASEYDWLIELKRKMPNEARLEFEAGTYSKPVLTIGPLDEKDEASYIENYLEAYLPLLGTSAFIDECKADKANKAKIIQSKFRNSMSAPCLRPLFLSVFIEVWLSKEGRTNLTSTEELLSEYLNKEKKRWKLILGDDILVDSYLRVLSVACIVGIFNITDVQGTNYLAEDCNRLISFFDARSGRPGADNLFEDLFVYETIKKYLQKFPESMHIRAAFIIASEAIYSPSAEYKRVPDKIINKAKQWSEQYPKKIEFQEAYFGLLFSRLKYAQAQDMRNEQRRVYREMKTVAERANYSEYNESNQLMESVDILHRVFGY